LVKNLWYLRIWIFVYAKKGIMKREELEAVLRGLLEPRGRPEEVTSTDMLLALFLWTHGAHREPLRMSNTTISMALNCTEPTLHKSVARLHEFGWVEVKSGKGRSNPNLYTLLIDKLPVAEPMKHTMLTPAMTALAAQYARATRVNPQGKRRRFTKGNLQRMAFTLQQFLNKHCGGDESLLRSTVNFAFATPKYKLQAYRGPHALRRQFGKLVEEHKQKQATEHPSAAA
jgi:hypothetical protein